MLIADENEFATQVGCWATCHHDSRYMPDHPEAGAITAELSERLGAADGITKYLRESRSDIEIRGRDGAPRGGWDNLLAPEEVAALMDGHMFVDLVRYKSGSGARLRAGGPGDRGRRHGRGQRQPQRRHLVGRSGDPAFGRCRRHHPGPREDLHPSTTTTAWPASTTSLWSDDPEAEINAAKR